MLSKLDGRAWRWLSPAAADGFEPVFSRSWGPDAPSRPGRAAGSCPRWESSKANLIWTRVCSHQYHQLVQAEHSVYPVKYRDTWYLCPLGNPDIAHLSRADLGGAYLHGANLCGADLFGAHFTGTDLSGAHLSGADLSGVLNLEQWRLDSALGDKSTKLPDGLHHPESLAAGEHGDSELSGVAARELVRGTASASCQSHRQSSDACVARDAALGEAGLPTSRKLTPKRW